MKILRRCNNKRNLERKKQSDDKICGKQLKPQYLFTAKQDEQLIQFVKQNKCLYNANHRLYRYKSCKVILWKKIGLELNRTHEECSKRWIYIRDYYVRKRRQPPQHGSAEPIRRRAELLSFIDSHATTKQPIKQENEGQPRVNDNNPTIEDADDSSGNNEYNTGPEFFNYDEQSEYTTDTKEIHQSNLEYATNDNLSWCDNREGSTRDSSCINHRELDLLHQIMAITNKEQDDVDLFFASMVQTVKGLPPNTRAELKLDIANLVGRAELKFLREQE